MTKITVYFGDRTTVMHTHLSIKETIEELQEAFKNRNKRLKSTITNDSGICLYNMNLVKLIEVTN